MIIDSDKIDNKLSARLLNIPCPYCGFEYLPAEIFIPSYFLGKPEDIERSREGKVLTVQGLPPQLEEEFECTRCNGRFKINAHLSFDTKQMVKEEFKEVYSSPLYKDRISLKED